MGSPELVFEYGAWEIDGSVADALASLLAPAVMLLSLGLLYFQYAKDQQRLPHQTRETNSYVILYATLAIMVFMLALLKSPDPFQ